jgi:hypothetical protein
LSQYIGNMTRCVEDSNEIFGSIEVAKFLKTFEVLSKYTFNYGPRGKRDI